MSYIVNQYSIYIMTLHIQTCIAFLIAIFILLNIFFFFQFKSHYTKNIFPIVFAYCIQLCSFQNRPYLKSFFLTNMTFFFVLLLFFYFVVFNIKMSYFENENVFDLAFYLF